MLELFKEKVVRLERGKDLDPDPAERTAKMADKHAKWAHRFKSWDEERPAVCDDVRSNWMQSVESALFELYHSPIVRSCPLRKDDHMPMFPPLKLFLPLPNQIQHMGLRFLSIPVHKNRPLDHSASSINRNICHTCL